MKTKPLFRDFMGLNVHTVQFKPDLYQPVARLVRDYHGLNWDVGDDTAYAPTFPLSRNKVDWERLYGSWRRAGYAIDVCLMFSRTPPDSWKDLPRDAYRYGLAFARFFGPSGPRKLVEAMEIGNEPGDYPDAVYRAVFENMAKGLRAGDPKLKVATCATFARESGKYHKSLETVRGLERLYDVINLHTYAQVEGYPTWRRSYPEDPAIAYLKDVREVIAWRDAHAPGKEVWITEFGWDASSKPAPATGTFAKWEGSTETQQAQYLVRSFLVFSAMPVDRAYIYFFNDSDQPSVHASAGLTRDFQPKPAFHAVAHLYRTLGDYRFAGVVTAKPGDRYVYEYRQATDPTRRLLAVWSPTGAKRRGEQTLMVGEGEVEKAERMPLTAGAPEAVRWESAGKGAIRLPVDESPTYLWLRERRLRAT